ncbi:histidine kinase [Paenibacillus sp. JX-17]|uniref:Histidine kinase n=1 Tax=Paenibacillus lacisoli TaxID=3064525 RepID=A0ABT9CIZ8_9BACL|nr:histidine kinase [Paenibacillus sp. JX-17]MDO7907588.1 histidine kinase [Paenibacillus sp. JX-17]
MDVTVNKPRPIRHYVKIMLLIAGVALILDFVISIVSISMVKEQSRRYLQDTAELYINRINHDFAYINHYMGWTLANDDSAKTMDTPGTSFDQFLKSSDNLRKRYTELQKNYGQSYNFFFYLKNEHYFLNYAPMSLSFAEYEELKKQIISYTDDSRVYEKFYSNWTPILIQDQYYIMNIVPFHNRHLICLISADDLIQPLQQINLGENGFSSLVDQDGRPLSSVIPAQAEDQQKGLASLLSLAQSRTTVTQGFSNASFKAQMVIQFGVFEKIMVAQLLILLLFLVLVCTVCFVILYFHTKLLKPIQSFSRNLTRIQEDGEPLDFRNSEIIELEQANTQFRGLVEQIKAIKIEMYEQELDKQRITLDYMKLQINPHFFLNCLTNIYSMAQMQMYQEIEYMSLSTSTYLRYIFQHGENFVRLEDEIAHVRIYLEIQKHRYRNALRYHIQQQENTADVTLPPLVIQTFIENAVKYAVSREHKLQIEIKVYQPAGNPEMTVIEIADTGPGFPEDILERLVQGKPLEQTEGKRIGIMNTLQRLELLYGQQAKVEFYNRHSGGACVTLTLPQPAAKIV